MSWLRNSQLTSSFSSKRSSDNLPKDCDPEACVETFKKHWQQAFEIIERTHPPKCFPLHDDVLGVVNHVGQMATLLVVELETFLPSPSPSPCLEHLLSEAILHKLFEWSQHTGRFTMMVKQEQMKLFEKLVSRAGQSLLVHEPFLKPLLRLLKSCCNDTVPLEQEKQLVVLLRQLCIALTQNIQLLDLFFTAKTQNADSSFILFTLLIPFLHRPGLISQQARDALLLCMSMSRHHDALGAFIADHSHVCPMLAAILSGLYSAVPRRLVIESEDWHRLTPDDVNELEDLTLFVNTLECCNAIVQEAHKSVREQLIDLISNGFLIPVMGTALLQNTEDELIAATAYYELFLRSTTAPGLRPTLCSFLMRDCFDEKRILTTLLHRIKPEASPRLRVVTLALLETLVGLDCEEVMWELALKYLTPCNHVMLSQRARLRDPDAFTPTALKLLTLSPAACQPTIANPTQGPLPTTQGNPVYGLRPEESLYGNYHAYLCDARSRIQACARACAGWRYPYDGESPPAEEDLPVSLGGDSSGYESLVVKGSPPNKTDLSGNGPVRGRNTTPVHNGLPNGKEAGSSPPRNVKESSPETEEELARRKDHAEELRRRRDELEKEPRNDEEKESEELRRHNDEEKESDLRSEKDGESSRNREECGDDLSRRLSGPDQRLPSTIGVDSGGDVGPFLDSLIGLVECMPNLSLQENLRVTGIISRLAVYPQPLMTSLLLNHSLVFQPSIRSFFQALRSLKQSVDSSLSKAPAVDDVIARARQFLLQREERLASMRKTAVEPPVQRRSLEPFSRGDSKRRSFSSAISSVFRMAMPTPEQLVENETPGSGYKYVRGRAGSGTDPAVWNRALCAVLMDEWLKELAAIAQEQMLQAISTGL